MCTYCIHENVCTYSRCNFINTACMVAKKYKKTTYKKIKNGSAASKGEGKEGGPAQEDAGFGSASPKQQPPSSTPPPLHPPTSYMPQSYSPITRKNSNLFTYLCSN